MGALGGPRGDGVTETKFTIDRYRSDQWECSAERQHW